MSCNCGSSCSCGQDCKCGKRSFDLGFSEDTNTTASLISGFAPTNTVYVEWELNYGAENDGCNCGSSCSCGSDCNCGK